MGHDDLSGLHRCDPLSSMNQVAAGKLLERCGNDKVAIGEVLTCYIFSKFMRRRRSAGEVLHKLYLLKMYLLATSRSQILAFGAEPFTILTKEVSQGSTTTDTLPGATTPQGLEAVNLLRRLYPRIRTSRPAEEVSIRQQLQSADLVDRTLPVYASAEQRENRVLLVGEESYSGVL